MIHYTCHKNDYFLLTNATFKAALIGFFDHLGAVEVAENTTVTYYHLYSCSGEYVYSSWGKYMSLKLLNASLWYLGK